MTKKSYLSDVNVLIFLSNGPSMLYDWSTSSWLCTLCVLSLG